MLGLMIFFIVFIFLGILWLSPEVLARAGKTICSTGSIPYNYLSYFSPQFLFLRGDCNLRHSILRVGELHLFDIMYAEERAYDSIVLADRRSYIYVLFYTRFPPERYHGIGWTRSASLTNSFSIGRYHIATNLTKRLSSSIIKNKTLFIVKPGKNERAIRKLYRCHVVKTIRNGKKAIIKMIEVNGTL